MNDKELYTKIESLKKALEVLSKPPVSEAQRKAMHAAASGKSSLGIPKSVGKEYADADKSDKLPKRMSKDEPHHDDPHHEAKEKKAAKKIVDEAEGILDMHKGEDHGSLDLDKPIHLSNSKLHRDKVQSTHDLLVHHKDGELGHVGKATIDSKANYVKLNLHKEHDKPHTRAAIISKIKQGHNADGMGAKDAHAAAVEGQGTESKGYVTKSEDTLTFHKNGQWNMEKVAKPGPPLNYSKINPTDNPVSSPASTKEAKAAHYATQEANAKTWVKGSATVAPGWKGSSKRTQDVRTKIDTEAKEPAIDTIKRRQTKSV